MARKRKLNTRVVTVLSILGGLCVLGGLALVMAKYLPKDYKPLVEKATKAEEGGDLVTAEEALTAASNIVKTSKDAKVQADVYLKLAKVEWAYHTRPEYANVVREKLGHARQHAMKSIEMEDSEDAHRLLADTWMYFADMYGAHEAKVGFIHEADILLKFKPNDHELLHRRTVYASQAVTSEDRQNAPEVIKGFNDCIRLKADEPQYYIDYAAFLTRVPDADDPAMILKRGLDANPKSGKLMVAQAQWLEQQDRKSEAVEAYKKAQIDAGTDPDVWESVMFFDLRQNAQGDLKDAIKNLKQLDPGRGSAYLVEGMLFTRTGKPDKAVDTYREGLKAMAKAPTTQKSNYNNQEAQRRYDQRKLTIHLGESLLARILYTAKDEIPADQCKAMEAEAQQCLDKVIADEGADSVGACSIKGRQFLVKSRQGDGRAALSDAIVQLKSAYEKAVKDSDARLTYDDAASINITAVLLYNAYERNGTPARGESILLDYLKFDEKSPQINLSLAKHYLRNNHDAALAERYIDIALRGDPKNPEALQLKEATDVALGRKTGTGTGTVPFAVVFTRIRQMAADGRVAEAIQFMEDLHGKQPNDMAVGNMLVDLYVGHQDMAKAKALIDDMITRHKDDPSVPRLKARKQLIGEPDPQKRYAIVLKFAEADQKDQVRILMTKANVALQFGHKDDAIKFLKDAEKANPDDGEVIEMQFNLAIAAKDFALAQKCVERAAKTDADKCKGLKFQAYLLASQGKLEDSIAVMEKILKDIAPDDKPLRATLGDLYLSIGKRKEAREHFLYLAKSDMTFFPGIKGMALLTADDPTQLTMHRAYVNQCLLIEPGDKDVRNWSLNLMVQDGHVPEAITARRQMYEREPGDLQNVQALAKLYEKNQPSAAQAMYSELLTRSPNPLMIASLYCTFLINNQKENEVYGVMDALLKRDNIDRVAGYILYGDLVSTLNMENARNAYQKAIDGAAKSDGRGFLAMGRFMARTGQPAEALKFYEKWLDATPAGVGSDDEYQLISLRTQVGQFDKAKARLNEILKAEPGKTKALFGMCELYSRQKDNASALKALDEAVRLNPKSTDPLLVRARFQEDVMGNLPEAQVDIDTALKLDRTNLQVAMNLANVLMRQHKLQEAADVLKSAHDQDNAYQPAIDGLVEVYMQLKKWPNVESLLSELRQRPSMRSDVNKQIQLLMIEAQMYHESQEKTKCLAALDAAHKLAGDEPGFMRTWLVWHVEFKDYDRVLNEAKGWTDPRLNSLRMYEAAALIGKNRLPQATAILTPMVKNAKGDLYPLLQYIETIYPPAEGVKIAQQWLALRDGEPLMQMFLGDMYVANKDIVSAEMAYAKGLEKAHSDGERLVLHSKRAQGLYNRYLEDRTKRDYLPKAIESWKEVLKLDPTNFAALNNLAYVYTDDMDSPAEALEYAQKAVRCDPQANVLDTLGWTQAKLAAAVADQDRRKKDLQAALVILQRAFDLEAELAPHTVAIAYHLAWVNEHLGDKPKAQLMYRTAEAALKDDQKDSLYKPVSDGINRTK